MTATRSRILPGSLSAGWLLVLAAGAAALVLFGPRMLALASHATPHGLDWDLLAAQPPVIRLHIAAAVCTVILGAAILSLRKGRTFHRVAGWTWTLLMLTAAGSSLFIVGLNGDMWSVIHILSGFVLLMAPLGVRAARLHRVDQHRRIMTGIFIGGSLVAGAFTFLPGRLMWTLFMG